MFLPELAIPAASAATIRVTLRYGPDAVLLLVAGITAIAAKDPKHTRADRALKVLRSLRSDHDQPDDTGPSS